MPKPRATAVLIVEQSPSGHRLDYVSFLAHAVKACGLDPILVTSPAVVTSNEFDRFSQRNESHRPVKMFPVLSERNTMLTQLSNTWRSLRLAHSHSAPLVIPNIDEKLAALLLLRPLFWRVRVRGIVMRPPKRDANLSVSIKRAIIRALRFAGMDLRELASPFDRSGSQHEILDPSGILDLPADDRSLSPLAEKIRTWANLSTAPVVGVVGVLDPRKSVLEILSAFEARTAESPYRLLIAGRPSDPEYGRQITEAAGRLSDQDVFVITRPLSDTELDVALDALNVMALLYQNAEGSSGFLAHGIRRGQAFVGLANTTVNRAIEQHEIGTVAIDLSPASVLEAIGIALGTPSSGRFIGTAMAQTCNEQWLSIVRA